MMKTVLLFLVIICSSALGYYLGFQNQKGVLQHQEDAVELEHASELYKNEKEAVEVKQSGAGKKKLSLAQRRKNFEATLEKYMNAAPYALVQKIYYARVDSTDKLAFAGVYERGEYESEQRKEIEQTIFERTLPVIKHNFYYMAQGTLRFDGKEIPYEMFWGFSYWPFDKKIMEKTPNEPKDLTYNVVLVIDVKKAGDEDGMLLTSTVSGMFNIYNDGNRSFVRLDNYEMDTVLTFKNVPYFLIEIPNVEEISTAMRLFNTSTGLWVEATEQVQWRSISKKEFTEAKLALKLY